MSTKKITALTELSAAPAATDVIPIVDVSDTTDAATGTTKKITATNVGKGIGIGAGNTTAEPVKIDTSGGNVGIGTAAPIAPTTYGGKTLNIADDDGACLVLTDANTTSDKRHYFLSSYATKLYIGTADDDGANPSPKIVLDSDGKVGIGTDTPTGILDLETSAGTDCNFFLGCSVQSAGATDDAMIEFVPMGRNAGDSTSYIGKCQIKALGSATAHGGFLTFITRDESAAEQERMRIDSTGNLLIGGTSRATSSDGTLHLFNGTAPSGNATNGVVLYAEDVSTSELKVRDEAGNVSTLSPHNFELLGGRSEPMAWSYANKNVFVGKEVNVDMMKVIRALEKLTGEEYIKIRDIADSEKLDWATEEKRKEAEQKKNVDSYKARKAESDAHPTSSSTKAEIKTFLDEKEIVYEDASKAELFEKVPEKPEFTESEPAAYTKKSKPSWIG